MKQPKNEKNKFHLVFPAQLTEILNTSSQRVIAEKWSSEIAEEWGGEEW